MRSIVPEEPVEALSWILRLASSIPKPLNPFLRPASAKLKATSNNPQFVTPAKAGVRNVKNLWIPAFAGMTFLEVASS